MPREAAEGTLGRGLGAGGGSSTALAPQGRLRDARLWGWDGSRGQMMPSAMGAVGTDACPGKKGSWRAAGVGQQGLGTVQAAGGHSPPAPNLRDQLCPPTRGKWVQG